MVSTPVIPESAPFSGQQRAWLNGWLVGALGDATKPGGEVVKAAEVATEPLLILYGSQSGSAEGLAKSLKKQASSNGFHARAMELNDYAKLDLSAEKNLVIVTSTWGDGDPPDNAVEFWNYISSDAAPRFENLRYAVLALGDSSYAAFCGAGKNIDERLVALGATRFFDRIDCDVDYEEPAADWIQSMWGVLTGHTGGPPVPGLDTNGSEPQETSADGPRYGRKHPFPAKLITNRGLNGPGSAKETRHFEISLGDSGLEYEAGDALGVVPTNCPSLVAEIVALLGQDGSVLVADPNGDSTTFELALETRYSITQITPKLLKAVAEKSADSRLQSLLAPDRKADLNAWLWGREIFDLLKEFNAMRLEPAEFVSLLRPLQPRLYSISSSPKVHPGEVHLTVSIVRYQSFNRDRKGVCSSFLADRVALSETPVPVFVHKSPGFRVPVDGDVPMIMVGPGTGVAPFRAFLEERQARGATGKNWLFFGDQTRATDFMYEEELDAFRSSGVLHRLDLAFSRDQAEKLYVQHRMIENAADLWAWLEAGAHFYVCGDAKRMAKDVDEALHQIIENEGGLTTGQAREYVKHLKTNKRYQRDVY